VIKRILQYSLAGGLPVAILILSLLSLLLALQLTPREEEPQIVVPMVDVVVSARGLSSDEVSRQVAIPLEKLLSQIPGVEHIYSTSVRGGTIVTLRFFVGEDREISLLNTYTKLSANQDAVPGVVDNWVVKPVEVDDVPILMLALWSNAPERYSDHELRRMADEMTTAIKSIPQTSVVQVIGGAPRNIQIRPDPAQLSARGTTLMDVLHAVEVSNVLRDAGQLTDGNRAPLLQTGGAYQNVEDLESQIINMVNGIPVYLREVAEVFDGPSDVSHYTWLSFAPGHESYVDQPELYPMVVISVAKQRGANAVEVAREVLALTADLKRNLLPQDTELEVIRNYGETADEKVNNLVASLMIAVLTVVVFVGVFMNWRAALVVGLAIPVCYGVTLGLDYLLGYTINRVTLFALILSLGLLVDDPITGIDNIDRFLRNDGDGAQADRAGAIVAAMKEISPALIMSTVTIVLAFVPLAFITGMMGPYMAPMAFNVPASVIVSTFVAFLVTPWLASRLMPAGSPVVAVAAEVVDSPYERLVDSLLTDRRRAARVLWVVALLFVITAMMPVFRMVPLKLLPFDNKNEVQVLVDAPEGSSLEYTASLVQEAARRSQLLPEVKTLAMFVGVPSPIDFNGLVRHYDQRTGSHQGEIRITLQDKLDREHQSHGIVLRLRQALADMNAQGVNISVVEVPPGPPVISTLVAELRGGVFVSYDQLREAAAILIDRLKQEPHVVEVDSTVSEGYLQNRFVVDKPKAALSGISTEDINTSLMIANQGITAGYMLDREEAEPLPITLRYAQADRADKNQLLATAVRGQAGTIRVTDNTGLADAPRPLVNIAELGSMTYPPADKPIYRKDLQPVVYVTAELSGRTPAEVIADVHADYAADATTKVDWQDRHFLNSGSGIPWQLPEGIDVSWSGEGEWRITLRVFRDMGLAYLFALVGIFVVLRVQTGSKELAGIIMLAIPLTIVGIMPGFWFLNQMGERQIAGAPDPVLFTATAMIGMIALAGIVVRNSLILVQFVNELRDQGYEIRQALRKAGAIRLRPILLTAGTTLLGNLVITLDPVFSGLALAIIFGILSSTVFTLLVVPVVYFLVFDETESPGLLTVEEGST